MKTNDYPVTDTELDAYYGVAPNEWQIAEAIAEASEDVDFFELTDALFDHERDILDAIAAKDAAKVGELVMKARRERIARIASRWLFKRPDAIDEKEVNV